MASVRRRRKSLNWVACYSVPVGNGWVRKQCSTGTRDKSLAIRIAIAAEDAARKKVTAERAREIISDVVEMIHGQRVSNVTCAVYFERWKTRKAAEVSEGSVTRFGDIFGSLAGSLGKTWEGPLSDVQPEHLAEWRDAISAKWAPATVNVCLKIAKQAFRDAWVDGLLARSPAEKLKMLKLPRGESPKKIFTAVQYGALMAGAEGEWKGMIMAGALTGQRLSDIVRMKFDQIDEDNIWRFTSRKTGHVMTIPLAAPMAAWLKRWRNEVEGGYVFPDNLATVKRAKNENVGCLSNRFYAIMAKAKLVPPRNGKTKVGVGRNGRRAVNALSFHSFRHTCTTWLKAAGVSESVAMAFIGHESKAVNRSYTHLPESALRDAMRKMERFTVAA